MDKSEVYTAVVEALGGQWAAKKPSDCDSLAPVGYNRQGVYMGLPVVIQDTPCLGVVPSRDGHEPVGNQYYEGVEMRLDVFFYAFSFDAEQEMLKAVSMAEAINLIIKDNRELGGLVDLWRLLDVEYGAMVRRAATGGEKAVAGGIAGCLLRKEQ
jgi:hypothetical protein